MNKRFFVFAVTVIALSGCAHKMRAAGPCDEPGNHCAQVTVKEVGGKPTITVDPYELHVPGQSSVIFWRLENAPGQNYKFPSDGVHFKTDPGLRQFSCRPMPQGDLFRCLDRGDQKGKFEYGVKLEGSPSVPVLDPWVINE